MSEAIDPTTSEWRLTDELEQVSRRLETMSEYAAKTAGELVEAIELLRPFAEAWESRPPEYDKGRSFTLNYRQKDHEDFRRAAEFVRAHPTGPQAAQGPSL